MLPPPPDTPGAGDLPGPPPAEALALLGVVVVVAELLRAETGQDLGLDLEAWREWLQAQGDEEGER
jgi:hypothetical protein